MSSGSAAGVTLAAFFLATAALTAQTATQDDLYDQAIELAQSAPREALDLLPQLDREDERERIRQAAILRAASIDRDLAARELTAAIDGASNDPDWLGEVGFRDACALAKRPDLARDTARTLLLASARRHAFAAVRAFRCYQGLAFGQEALDAAALRAPDEAALAATGNSRSAAELREALAASSDPTVRTLATLIADDSLPSQARPRLGFFAGAIQRGEMTKDEAVELASDTTRYFRELANRRLASEQWLGNGDEAAGFDWGLQKLADRLAHAYQQSPEFAPELEDFEPRELYLVLAYAQPEDEDFYFRPIFDRLFAPRVPSLGSVMELAGHLRHEDFVEAALSFRRFRETLRLARGDEEAAAIVARLFEGLDLNRSITAADAIDQVQRGTHRTAIAQALARQTPRNREQAAVKSALIAQVNRGEPEDDAASLRASQLYDGNDVGLQRHFFYNDRDGVESFASFRAQYANDPAWTWEERGDWVRLVGRGGEGRTIEIVANIPVDLHNSSNEVSPAEAEARQDAVTEFLGQRRPSVVVHRGHAYHVPKTIGSLSRAARLVYLGSCRGMANIRAVMEASPQAQVIASRETGTLRVNDPLLKALNDAILRSDDIHWPSFWERQRRRFRGDPDFASYLPPHRNAAAWFLRNYDRELAQ